jgi:integrase
MVSSRAIVMQRKPQRPVQFEITEPTRESIAAWVARRALRSTSYLFGGRRDESHLSVGQYSRMVKGWAACIGLDQSRYGTHSLRCTKATLIYKRTKNIRAIQLLLGHTNWKARQVSGDRGGRRTRDLGADGDLGVCAAERFFLLPLPLGEGWGEGRGAQVLTEAG